MRPPARPPTPARPSTPVRTPTLVRPPTPAQRRVVDFIRRFVAERGFPPTHAEIATGLGFASATAAAQHLRLLVRKGVVAIEPGRSRGLKLLEAEAPRGLVAPLDSLAPLASLAARPSLASRGGGVRRLPVIGEVAAGQPILAQQHLEREVELDGALFRAPADFLLRVRGDSMVEAGIEPDDLVAVQRTPTVSDGEIAVVRLDDEVTVKRFRLRGRGTAQRVVLEPANARLQPFVVDPVRTQVVIEGRVVGLVRTQLRGRGR
ncbi:MAG: transcriptional repressor LexA [Planctomycetes bacterium]|nr:transcriptional repressor LexA [Planctomycetota bacterium]